MTATPDSQILTNGDLDALLAEETPLLIFKHSTRCPISTHAHHEFQAWLGEKPAAPRTALVRVVEERAVSLEIARRLGVTHQSPQAILVENGVATWDASHDAITRESLARATRQVSS